ncbi:MAG: AAA family ATPase [Bacilli bacterium]
MIYLKKFQIPSDEKEYELILSEKRMIFNNVYPLKIFPQKEITMFDFDREITIFYGGNGSGKSTLLNVIASSIKAKRKHSIETNDFFNNYVNSCQSEFNYNNFDLREVKIITSDDVFNYILSVNEINSKVNLEREKLIEEYFKKSDFDFNESYDDLLKRIDKNRYTLSKFVRKRIGKNNIISQSNGETALSFWEEEITENAIYLLDEPENSLSAVNQLKLKQFIEDSARFYNCQFFISTHSPFLLSMKNVTIYDLDSVPCCTKNWNELDNMKVYYDFFKKNKDLFE